MSDTLKTLKWDWQVNAPLTGLTADDIVDGIYGMQIIHVFTHF